MQHLRTCFTLAILFLAPALAWSQSVRVLAVSGAAEIQTPHDAAPRLVVRGDEVTVGTRITTGSDGRVVLTPMPGVQSIITPGSTVLLESASTTADGTATTHQALLDLRVGAIVTDLQRAPDTNYDYSIRTARGVAGARGTTYTVGINEAGVQSVIVTQGAVTVQSLDGTSATLAPGQFSFTNALGQTTLVTSLANLSPAQRSAANNLINLTLNSLAAATQSGVPTSVLQSAIQAAEQLGVEIAPETRANLNTTFSAPPTTSSGQSVSAFVASLRGVSAEERQALILTFLANNPNLAPSLVEALIATFPGDASTLTANVVDSLLSLNLPNNTTSDLLTEVARRAVQAALQIPETAVPDRLATINDVKAALANVPPDFTPFVAAYITPLTRLPESPLTAGGLISTEDLPTQVIVSDDTP